MRNRVSVAVVGALVGLASVVFVDPVHAAPKPKVLASGAVQCTIAGKISYSPPLKAAQVPTTARVTGNLTCSTGQTGTGAKVYGGKVNFSSPSFTGSCSYNNMTTISGSITWKSATAKVLPTSVALTAGADRTNYRFQTQSINGGSYTSHPIDITGKVASPACVKKGIRKAGISGSADIGSQCTSNILTGHGILQKGDQHLWFVVASFCGYTPPPTGTITWTRAGPPAICTGSKPLVDSGNAYAFTPWGLPRNYPYTFWGIDSGLTLEDFFGLCTGPLNLSYSGDARYRPYTQVG